MMWYAETPARRSRQILGDAAVVVWVAAWIQLGRSVHHAVNRLGTAGKEIANAGSGLSGALTNAATKAADLPLVGGSLAAPLRDAGTAANRVTDAGLAQESAVARLALILGIAVALVPALPAVLWVIPRRLRWSRAATAATRLRNQDQALLALRAVASRPLSQLQELGPQLGQALLAGDPVAINALARLELADLGLRLEPVAFGVDRT